MVLLLFILLLLTQIDPIRLLVLAKQSRSRSLRKRTHWTFIDARACLNTYQQGRHRWSRDFIPLDPWETFEQFKQVTTVWNFRITFVTIIHFLPIISLYFHSISIILNLESHGPLHVHIVPFNEWIQVSDVIHNFIHDLISQIPKTCHSHHPSPTWLRPMSSTPTRLLNWKLVLMSTFFKVWSLVE